MFFESTLLDINCLYFKLGRQKLSILRKFTTVFTFAVKTWQKQQKKPGIVLIPFHQLGLW